MADLTLESAIATKTMTLAATTFVLTIPARLAQEISGLYLYCTAEVSYQILPDGSAVSGAAAPTADYDIIPAATRVPIAMPERTQHYASGPLRIAVWAAGAATLHVSPYPVSR